MRRWACSALAVAACVEASPAVAQDSGYGRFDGDLAVAAEIGVTETIGEDRSRGESMALRLTFLYLITAGAFAQYNESFGIDSQPIARSVVGGIELRPLFLGRWAEDLVHGPPHFDLWLDSISLTLGVYNLWRHGPHCAPPPGGPPPPTCHGYGMEASLGMELPLLPQANAPFISLRGGLRWSLDELGAGGPAPPPMGLITLSVGYHHLFETHLVDAADSLPP